MAETTSPETALLTTDDDLMLPGVAGRTLLSGVALATESVKVAKLASLELVEVADATAFTTFDVLDDLAEEMAGPFTSLVKAPTAVSRAAYQAGATGVRKVLTAA